MISILLEMIGGLQGEVFFFVEDGPLKNKLVERYMDEEGAHADILEFDLDSSIRIRWGEGSAAPVFECRLEAGDFEYQSLFSVGDFEADEITELIDRLRPHCPNTIKKEAGPGRNILRKKKGGGFLNISEASKALGLSHSSLKALIPCSEIRIVEEGGDKTIEQYYWTKDLIGRFESLWEKQKEGRGHNSEDVTFIAECCCDGDLPWARDTIAGFLQQRAKSTERC